MLMIIDDDNNKNTFRGTRYLSHLIAAACSLYCCRDIKHQMDVGNDLDLSKSRDR